MLASGDDLASSWWEDLTEKDPDLQGVHPMASSFCGFREAFAKRERRFSFSARCGDRSGHDHEKPHNQFKMSHSPRDETVASLLLKTALERAVLMEGFQSIFRARRGCLHVTHAFSDQRGSPGFCNRMLENRRGDKVPGSSIGGRRYLTDYEIGGVPIFLLSSIKLGVHKNTSIST